MAAELSRGSITSTSCPTHFTTVLASVEALTEKNNGLGPTVSEIFKDVEGRSGRQPSEKLLPKMLQALGFIEMDGKWSGPTA